MDAELQARCEVLPIFPLPRLVFMPSEVIPLHVFEPRYRALLQHCLATGGWMGLATLAAGGWVAANRPPPIAEALGIGRIIRHEPLPDGRANIVVEHVARARLVRELDSEYPFRLVEAEVRDDVPASDNLTSLRTLLLQFAALAPEGAADATRIAKLEPTRLVDEVARRLLDEPADRLGYVGLDRVDARARLVEERLASLFLSSRSSDIEA
jgi:Lon protease-like protein